MVIDPHDGHSLGVRPPRARADYAFVTHQHFDHSATRVVEKPGGSTQTFVAPSGAMRLGPFDVRSFGAFHDNQSGKARGPVRMLSVRAAGVHAVHVGDLGHELDAATCAAIGEPDLLFLPAGGVFTLEAGAAWRTAKRLGARVVVPMHYKTPGLALPLGELEDFLQGRQPAPLGQSLEVHPEDLPSALEVWTFDR